DETPAEKNASPEEDKTVDDDVVTAFEVKAGEEGVDYEKLIKKLILIVENSLDDESLSVESLASEVGMSRANLYRKLQSILDETPVNFIKKIRLKQACQLLKKKNMYISEIAYMTGFSNPKYFAKCFQKEFGISPTKYAKKYENVKEEKRRPQVELSDLLIKVD
ncbi:MAG: helix-turn-helix transcriptional regulator, partial [Bacteroidota bacterium]